ATLDSIKSITTYTGNEGEEKAQYTYSYNYAGDTIKTVTDFDYTADRLTQSTAYRNNTVTDDILLATMDVIKSITTYFGDEGEEKAQSTYNFNFDGNLIKTVTEFTYSSETLTQSSTYRNNTPTDQIDQATMDVIKSITTYSGDEGEEKAEYTYKYNFDGDMIKTVTEFTYSGETRANSGL
ncbi:unnamed protein product, partial [marine sediment metagenome]